MNEKSFQLLKSLLEEKLRTLSTTPNIDACTTKDTIHSIGEAMNTLIDAYFSSSNKSIPAGIGNFYIHIGDTIEVIPLTIPAVQGKLVNLCL